jgi:cytochrome bd ubiquinol oxidase subunit II
LSKKLHREEFKVILDYATLKLIWLLLIGVLFSGFAITGGFDLGVGTLLPFIGKNDRERRLILNSIGPTWEGNQVWFISAAGALFAAMPLLYAAAFSGFYLMLLLILLPLILRPPGMDYRSKLPSRLWRNTWDYCLFLSGCIPSILFGAAFGNVFTGIDFYYDLELMPRLRGSFLSLLNPLALLCGVVSLSIIILQGALFLQSKTTGSLQERALKATQYCGILFIFSFALAWYWVVFKTKGFNIVSMPHPNQIFSPLSKQVLTGTGFWLKNYQKFPIGYLGPLSSFIGLSLALIFSAYQRPGFALFCNSIALMGVISTAGFTLFPFLLPSATQPNHSLTIWDAASSQLTLAWMLGATLILLPIVLSYTIWVFRVMRGTVSEKTHLEKSESY